MTKIDAKLIGYSVYPPGTSYGPYVTSTYELVWIEEGSAHLTADGRIHNLARHSVAFSRPGERNHYQWDSRRTTQHGYVLFEVSTPPAPAIRTRQLTDDDVVLSLLRHVRWLDAERPVGWRDATHQALTYALRAFVTGCSRTRSAPDRGLPEPIERALTLVRNQWAVGQPRRSPSLPELAAAAAVTPEHLCRVFAAELGLGPASVLRLLRLHHAASLLLRTNMTVAQIARQSGFDDQFHFSRAFKRRFDVSPLQFRRRQVVQHELPAQLHRLAAYV